MSISLPSREIFAVDVPEVDDFTVDFKYMYFVPDEQTVETSGMTTMMLKRSTSEMDDKFVNYLTQRAPRYVRLLWKCIKLKGAGNTVTSVDSTSNSFSVGTQKINMIADNYNKIVTEDHFSTSNFVAVTFHDAEIDNKIYNFISGSYEQLLLNEPTDQNVSANKKAAQLIAQIPQSIDSQFISNALAPADNVGKFKYTNTTTPDDKKPVVMPLTQRLKDAYVNCQINSRLFSDVTGRIINDPHSPFTNDVLGLHKSAITTSTQLRNKMGLSITENEFNVNVPYIDVDVNNSAAHSQQTQVIMVGYVIDKYEMTPDGSIKQLPSIIVEGANIASTVDLYVKYNHLYVYAIRSIALFNIPAIDSDTGDMGMLKVLISSRPSNRCHVKMIDTIAPPPPSDINFTWNYETDKLLVHWTFPPNAQRDIKRFQVFRRVLIDEPFELLKEYDFDDSSVRTNDGENPSQKLVENLTSPATFYIDDDFTKDSKYMYTLCSIDAHGLTSNYGAQFEIKFDRYKNHLVKRLISHSGAPKQYPNMYIEGTGFVDVAHISGKNLSRMKLYFNPQFYQLEDDSGRMTSVLSTNQTNGAYKFQFINVDNQKSDVLTVRIDDKTQQIVPKIKYVKQQTTRN